MIYGPGESQYEALRQAAVWNAIVPDRRPDSIARPASPEDVVEVVRKARAEGHRIAIKSGGHNWRGAGLRDEGTMIDLAGLNHVEVDADRGIALVQPGATHQDLADALVPRGFAFPIGHCETVGLGGYLLAGGYGWNPRTWGPACWSVVGVDIVTVDGERMHIDSEHEPDLFWAARGGAAGFPAIVTCFHVRLQRLSKIATRRVRYPLDNLPELLVWSTKLEDADPGLEISLIAHTETDADGRPTPCTIVQATGFAESLDQAERLLEDALGDVPASATPLAAGETAEVSLNSLEAEAAWVHGRRYGVDMCWVGDAYEEVGRHCAEAIASAPSPLSRIVLAWGFTPGPGPDVAQTCNGTLTVNVYGIWERPDDDAANESWVRETMSELDEHITGFYAGEADLSVSEDRPRRSYPPEKWERLAAIRKAYDPDGVKFGFISEP